MTQQPPEQPAPNPGQPAPTNPPTQPETGKQPPWGTPENFNAEKAWELIQNLRNEKADPGLRTELDQLKTAQQQQRDALASALGLKPEETSDVDKLNERLTSMQSQIAASERRALAAEFKVPEALITGDNTEAMRAAAQQLVEFATGAHAAAVLAAQATASAQPGTPAFVPNPGQGQAPPPSGGAESYADFYDEHGRPRS